MTWKPRPSPSWVEGDEPERDEADEADEAETPEAAEVDEPEAVEAPAEVAEPQAGLGSVDGEELAAAEEAAPEVHQAARRAGRGGRSGGR